MKITKQDANSRVIKNYYIGSIEYLERRYDEIRELCNKFNARAIQKMTAGALYALLCGVLMGCGETVRDKYDRWMTELDCPVILMSKTDKAVSYPAISVRDGSGRIRTFERCEGGMTANNCSDMVGSISDSRMVGDTLKPCD